jgi:RNA polymerase sigma factor (sigma-70 family)
MREPPAASGQEGGVGLQEVTSGADVRAWYEAYAADVYRYVARRLGDTLAADVTAETFRIAVQRADSFDATVAHPRAWLFGIATNVIRVHWRTEQRRLRAMEREARRSPTTIDPLLDVERRVDAVPELAAVLALVADLPPDDRDLLTLYAWEGCSYVDVAAALGIPVGTVRSRLHRIRQAITPGGHA